jgi:transposase-like protein
MRLKLILPVVVAEKYAGPEECPYGCEGKEFWLRQEVKKPVRDTEYEEVMARRYECLHCHGTFRVYPQGVTQAHISQRIKGMAVMLYLLGLSYGAVTLMLEALGLWIGKTTVYEAVQAAAERVPGMKQKKLLEGYRTCALGADLTSVRCKGQWLPLGVTVDALNGWTLSIDDLSGEDAQTLKEWLEPIVAAVDASVLVTDDADALKTAADENGMEHQVCKSHVGRNTDALIEQMLMSLAHGVEHSLEKIDVSVEQASADLLRLKELIHLRQPQAHTELEAMYQRYQEAKPSPKGKPASLAYRLRNLFLDRWNLWPRLTFYRSWKDASGREILDGTNNATERAIGWWIKERYRTMRGYKRIQSALNVSRLIAYCGNHLSCGLELASLMN